jgi:hypothetical protein
VRVKPFNDLEACNFVTTIIVKVTHRTALLFYNKLAVLDSIVIYTEGKESTLCSGVRGSTVEFVRHFDDQIVHCKIPT